MSRLLDVTELTSGYSRAPILRDLDLCLDEGEVLALLGANGAGKTTLLRALSGSLRAWRGSIVLREKRIDGLSPWKRVRMGMAHVPEGRRIFGAMTVAENLEAASLVRPSARRAQLALVEDLFPRLVERRDQRAGSMSGGEQQMLAIGRALMTGPALLLIDEMSAGLAPVVVDQLVDGLAKVREEGISILLVEQSPHFVAPLVDRVALIEHGHIVSTGTLDDLGGVDALAAMYLGIS